MYFALPVIVGAFILTAAFLNASQSLTTVLLPDSYWLALLSFAVPDRHVKGTTDGPDVKRLGKKSFVSEFPNPDPGVWNVRVFTHPPAYIPESPIQVTYSGSRSLESEIRPANIPDSSIRVEPG